MPPKMRDSVSHSLVERKKIAERVRAGSCTSVNLGGTMVEVREMPQRPDGVVDPVEAQTALANLKASLGISAPRARPQLGRYELLGLIGQGGFGRVYRGHDPQLDRPVAIKRLHAAQGETKLRKQVRNESRALAKLSHPNVVNIYDVGEGALAEPGGAAGSSENATYIVMEFVTGQTVEQWIEESSPSVDEVLDVYLQAGGGLEAAHRNELLHLDFKPANVMRAADGRVVVLDFGLARLRHGAVAENGLVPASLGSTRSLGQIAGTPWFMPPEQFETSELGPSADIYAFAASVLRSLCHGGPAGGGPREQLLESKRSGPPAIPKEFVPRRVAAVLRKGLEPDPAARWASMAQMLDALRAARRPAWRGRSTAVAGAVLVVIAPAAVAIVAGSGVAAEEPCDAAVDRLDLKWKNRRAAVEQRLLEAGQTVASVDAALAGVDDYLVRSASDYQRACTADLDSERRRATLECLDGDASAVATRIDIVARSEASARAHAGLITDLSIQIACDSEEFLELQPLPTDPEARESLAKLSAWAAGDHPDSTPQQVAETIALARAIGHRPTLSAVLRAAGGISYRGGDSNLARQRFEVAFEEATAGGAHRVALKAAASVSGVDAAGLTLPVHERWAKTAYALCDRLENTERLRATVSLNLSQAQLHYGKVDAAAKTIMAALPFVDGADINDRLPMRLLYAAGAVSLQRERFDEGIRYLERAAETSQRMREGDPFIAEIDLAVASAYLESGAREEAEAKLRKALERPGDPDVERRTRGVLALAIAENPARLDEAAAMLEKLTALAASQAGEDSMAVADVSVMHAEVLAKQGKLGDARALLRAARFIYATSVEANAVRLNGVDEVLAEVERLCEDDAEAMEEPE